MYKESNKRTRKEYILHRAVKTNFLMLGNTQADYPPLIMQYQTQTIKYTKHPLVIREE